MCIKTPELLKRQQFNDGESEKTAPIVYKCQRFDEHNNKKGQSLNEDKNDGDRDKYILLPPTAFLLLSQKKLNRPSDLSEGIKSLTYLICI